LYLTVFSNHSETCDEIMNSISHDLLSSQPEFATERLYRQIAAQIAIQIDNGTLQSGTKAPSVRRLSSERGVSISTALAAYRSLENDGYLEARPQSGYYVRDRRNVLSTGILPPEIEQSSPSLEPTTIRNADLVVRVLQASNYASNSGNADLYQLGAAICCPSFLPTDALNKCLINAAKQFPEVGNSYDFAPGTPVLRTAIARRALDYGLTLHPDDIVLTVGATEALNLCLRAVTKPGDAVAIGSPTYYNILQLIESLGLRAVEVATHPRDGVVLESLEEALEREKISACLFMPSFGNPLGARMSDDNKKRLVAMLEKWEVPLIEDDVWGDTNFDGARPKPAKCYDQTGNVLLVSGFSKTLAPGYRVGWVAAGRFRKRVEYLKLVSSEANPTLPSLAIAEFLSHGGYEYHLRRIRRYFAEQTQMALEGVAKHFPEGTKTNRPKGAHFLWVELPEEIDTVELFEDAIKEGILIAPGPIFSARQKFKNYMRLNCGYNSPQRTDIALAKLGAMMKKKQG
jgi:DNA-binding transcriptional MocR family regulator